MEETMQTVSVKRKKSVIYLGSEAAPFIATGGLADVMGSLPKAVAGKRDYDVSCILPLYSAIKKEFRDQFEYVTNFNVQLSWRSQYCGVFRYRYQGVTFYFLDNEYYFAREGKIYGHYDDGERFAFFSKAALDTIAHLGIYPDVLHANDWQTAAAIVYLKGMYYRDEDFRRIRTVFTIHNIEYQGIFGMDAYDNLFGFDGELHAYIEHGGCINLMKAAIEMSDFVTTVSPTYANEIKNPFYAHGLETVVERNAHKLVGILNGIDTKFYDPSSDTHIAENYSFDRLEGKAVCKEELQKMLNLPVRPEVPVVAMITRLVSHKGVDLVKEVLEQFLHDDVQFILLGTGDSQYENYFSYVSDNYSFKMRSVIAFNQDLSRKIYAGSDIFLMPSKMEPCGLSQMIASRYGSVAVVRETGGLNDSIFPYYEGKGNGFTFHNYNAYDMLFVLRQAVSTFWNKDEWSKVVRAAMTTDFSWKKQAEKYIGIYEK